MLPFDDQLYVGRVRGSVLKALATSPRAAGLMIRGVTVRGGTVKINGRDVEANTWYRVSTTRFMVEGGEGGIGGDAETVELEPFGTQGPREFIAAWLDRPHEGDITQIPVDPARRTRWTFNASIDLGFNLVNVANPAGSAVAGTTIQPYGDAQLTRSDTMAVRGDRSSSPTPTTRTGTGATPFARATAARAWAATRSSRRTSTSSRCGRTSRTRG
jgi:hypothetical protein